MNEKELLNEEEYESVITLSTPEGEEVEFTEIATVEFEGKTYALLQPVELFEGMEEDEVIVFATSGDTPETSKYSVVTDDRILDGVFEEYYKMYEEYQNKAD